MSPPKPTPFYKRTSFTSCGVPNCLYYIYFRHASPPRLPTPAPSTYRRYIPYIVHASQLRRKPRPLLLSLFFTLLHCILNRLCSLLDIHVHAHLHYPVLQLDSTHSCTLQTPDLIFTCTRRLSLALFVALRTSELPAFSLYLPLRHLCSAARPNRRSKRTNETKLQNTCLPAAADR